MGVKRKRAVKRTKSEWRDIFKRHSASGLTIKEFCDREHLVQSTFKRWQNRMDDSANAQFVELAPSPPRAVGSSWDLEVRLPDGLLLRFRGQR